MDDLHSRSAPSAHAARLRIPPEILAETFMHCLPPPASAPSLVKAPLLLCGICFRWRDIAIATPALWSSLAIDLDALRTDNINRMVDFYRLYLSRARGAPLSLYTGQSRRIQAPAGPAELLLRTITGMSGQWRIVEFGLRRDTASFIFPRTGAHPLLEELWITDVPFELPISFCDAPKLRTVSTSLRYPEVQLPWHQLTKLHCWEVPVPSCLEILRDASSLLEADLQLNGGPHVIPTSVLQHTRLQCLELVADEEAADIKHVLRWLKIPGLKYLALDFTISEIPFTDVSPFLTFLSSCQLHTFKLSFMPVTSGTLVECLKATPSLVHLKIEPVHRVVHIDTIFAHFTGSTDFLPELESFHTLLPHEYDMSRLTVVAVNRMLCWRWAAVGTTRLRSFRLGYYGEAPEIDEIAVHSDCQRLRAEGMKLYFGSTHLPCGIDEMPSL
ncbi:hypothetical protein C8R47DRAFT_1123413 [Mycena vitilis]|nr:hypothetical protein C8R47DRAFT_1123413 [Mycena vitilis]